MRRSMFKRILTFCVVLLVFSANGFAQNQIKETNNEGLKNLEPEEINSKQELENSQAYQLSKLMTDNPDLLRLYSQMHGLDVQRVKKRLLPVVSSSKEQFGNKRKLKASNNKALSKSETFNWDGSIKLGLINRVFISESVSKDSVLTWREYFQSYRDGQIEEQGNYKLSGDMSSGLILNQRDLRNLENGKWQNGSEYFYTVNNEGQTTSWETRWLNNGNWNYSNKVVFEYNQNGLTHRSISHIHDYGSWQPNLRTTFNYKLLNNGNFAYDSTLIEGYNTFTGTWTNSQLTIASTTDTSRTDLTLLWDESSSEWYKFHKSSYFYDQNGNDTLYLEQQYDTSNGSWNNYFREITTYNSDGHYTEFYTQQYDTVSGSWVNQNRTTATWSGDNQTSRTEYSWSISDAIWLLEYENSETFNSDNTTETFTYRWYDSGTYSYGYTEEFIYDSDGDWTTKKSWEINHDGVKTPAYIMERTYTSGENDETELLTLSDISDLPNDQGGFVQFEIGGLHATRGEIDLNTDEFQVWWYNGSAWENVKSVSYDASRPNIITAEVPYTLPAGGDSTDYINSFQVTAHTQEGAFLSATGEESGVAVDNIAPAKVSGLNISKSEEKLDMNWVSNSSSDVDGYYVFEYSADDNYEMNNSLGFSNSNNITIDKPGEEGDYQYVILAMDENNNIGIPSDPAMVSITTGSEELSTLPDEFSISQNYPNPFNPTTEIKYSIPENSEVRIEVFNMLGRKIRTLVNKQQAAGRYNISFDATNLTSGTYFYRIKAGSFTNTQKMMLIK